LYFFIQLLYRQMDKIGNIENLFPIQRKSPATRKTFQYKMGPKPDIPADEDKKEPKSTIITKSDKYNNVDRSLLLGKLNKKNAKLVGIVEKAPTQTTIDTPSYAMYSIEKPREIFINEETSDALLQKETPENEETITDHTEPIIDEDEQDQLIVTKKQTQDIVFEGSPEQETQTYSEIENKELQQTKVDSQNISDDKEEKETIESMDADAESEPVFTKKKSKTVNKDKIVLDMIETNIAENEVLPEEIHDSLQPISMDNIQIQGAPISLRIPMDREKIDIPLSPYYLENRKMFISKLNPLFSKYREEIINSEDSISCSTTQDSTEFDLLTHQKIVREYLNLYSPYRGLLLYHGLGSGKTCTSIAIAEGMKSDKPVIVMTPASLKQNFYSELKKCGDDMYKKNQHWDFISSYDLHNTEEPIHQDASTHSVHMLDYNEVRTIADNLAIPFDFVKAKKGLWLMDVNNTEHNYSLFTSDQQSHLDQQLDHMIRHKYRSINYNGLTKKTFERLIEGNKNPFDNAVVIVDEAHNFVSRIVNKLKQTKSISYQLYNLLMSAQNVRIVFLSGTPIINYPNEIGIMFNILRGYIYTWEVPLKSTTSKKLTTATILNLFDKHDMTIHDFVDYSRNVLRITRNPFGFVNKHSSEAKAKTNATEKNKPKNPKPNNKTKKVKKTNDTMSGGYGTGKMFQTYKGVQYDEQGNISNEDFIQNVVAILQENNVSVTENKIVLHKYTALPDKRDEFNDHFINVKDQSIENKNLFQRRILGLTSYFRSAQEELLPSLVMTPDDKPYHIIYCPMSGHQYGIYEKIRNEEAEQEKKRKKRKSKKEQDELYEIAGTYRIFSRAACNFTFPDEIERPMPSVDEDKVLNENMLDNNDLSIIQEVNTFGSIDIDDAQENNSIVEPESYMQRIERSLELLSQTDEENNTSKYLRGTSLESLSPKFYRLLNTLLNQEYIGLHLIYSNFRTLEGIGIIRLILLANGFAEFKLSKSQNQWVVNNSDEDLGKPRFVLYTGTESAEEKELIRNIYNGSWDLIPPSLASSLREQHDNNRYGEIIKIFMITASGAEGINLRNTRYVHIVEPYWHNVRLDQVLGRARRICSHQDLPLEHRTVQTFLYIATLSEEQKTSKDTIGLRIRDTSRFNDEIPVTTDESLYETAMTKQNINNDILHAVKEAAVDCQVYASTSKNKHPIVCYGYGKVESNAFGTHPSFEDDAREKGNAQDKRVEVVYRKVTLNGEDYMWNEDTSELYQIEHYNEVKDNPNLPLQAFGRLVQKNNKYIIEKM